MIDQSFRFRSLAIPALALLCSAGVFAQRVDSIPLRANMSPLNEIPIIEGNTGTGNATVWVHAVRAADGTITSATVDFNVRFAGLPEGARITGLHIHRGTAAVNGPVVINTGITAGSNVTTDTGRGSISRPAQVTGEALAVVRDLLDNPEAFYINLHTNDFPGGLIRGQMIRATQTILMTSLSPANEVPPVDGLAASGTATIVQVAGRDSLGRWSAEVTFDIQYTGFPAGTRFTGLHIHTAAAGSNGPVTIDSGLRGPVDAPSSGAGNIRMVADANTAVAATQSAVAGLPGAPENYYVNLHTTANPGGAIRGQLQNPDRAILTANMSPANEVPPLDLAASAVAQVIAAGLRNDAGAITAGTVIFNVSPAFPETTTFTGLHIHEGPAGQNGPVRIDSGITGANNVAITGGAGNIYRIAALANANALAALNGLLLNPANYYLNLHTTTNPGGAVRAQMGSTNTALPTITDVGGVVNGERIATAPVNGRFIIRGSNLAFASGSAVGVVGGREPTTINGTSVTVAGQQAFILSVAPDQIIGRVPVVGLGPLSVAVLPVVVTNRNGASNIGGLTVSWAAY